MYQVPEPVAEGKTVEAIAARRSSGLYGRSLPWAVGVAAASMVGETGGTVEGKARGIGRNYRRLVLDPALISDLRGCSCSLHSVLLYHGNH